jgi:hypothetical protein
MAKWKLMLTTLPFVALVVILALVRDTVLQIKGVIDFGDVGPLLAAISLIFGFMLAGVLSDFKEAERLPAEIATTLETIGDTIEVVGGLNQTGEIGNLSAKFRAVVTTIEDWLLDRAGVDQVYAMLNDFNLAIRSIHSAIGAGYAIRCLDELRNLRRSIARVDVIERTSFIQTGYALLDVLVGVALLMLLMANYNSVVAEYFLISLFSLVYIYLVRMVRDIDGPFEYQSLKGRPGYAEANPYPVIEYRKRLAAGKE